jgi:hypothetical protein
VFEDATSFETPEFQAAVKDTPNFLDVDRVQTFSFEAVEVVKYPP